MKEGIRPRGKERRRAVREGGGEAGLTLRTKLRTNPETNLQPVSAQAEVLPPPRPSAPLDKSSLSFLSHVSSGIIDSLCRSFPPRATVARRVLRCRCGDEASGEG